MPMVLSGCSGQSVFGPCSVFLLCFFTAGSFLHFECVSNWELNSILGGTGLLIPSLRGKIASIGQEARPLLRQPGEARDKQSRQQVHEPVHLAKFAREDFQQ